MPRKREPARKNQPRRPVEQDNRRKENQIKKEAPGVVWARRARVTCALCGKDEKPGIRHQCYPEQSDR